MSLRSPLGRVLGLGSAKEGTDHWLGQRTSAIALLLLGLWFVTALLRLDGFDYLSVSRFIAAPVNAVLLLLFTGSLARHSWLGIQVVIEDYVHTPALKITALLASRFLHLTLAMVALVAILGISFDA